jgi:hypothetical protein
MTLPERDRKRRRKGTKGTLPERDRKRRRKGTKGTLPERDRKRRRKEQHKTKGKVRRRVMSECSW